MMPDKNDDALSGRDVGYFLGWSDEDIKYEQEKVVRLEFTAIAGLVAWRGAPNKLSLWLSKKKLLELRDVLDQILGRR